jgi:hypothetical protein
MKSSELEVGMEVAIGPPSSVKRAVVLGFGWEQNRWVYSRAERFRPTRDGKGPIAVAVLSTFRFSRDGDVPIWEPDVVRPQQIRGEWSEIKAEGDRKDAAARAARLAEAERAEAFTARLDSVEAFLTEFEGEVVTLRSQGDRVLVPIEILERLLDTLAQFSDDPSLTGVRSGE